MLRLPGRGRARPWTGNSDGDGVRYAGLYTARFGPSPSTGAPVIVMVHGLGLSGRYFTPLARRLAAAGYSVLVPDLPGNVRSRGAARSMPGVGEQAAALERWHTAAGLGACAFVANSVGCQVTAALAVRRPALVTRMVLTGPALDLTVPSAWRQSGRLLVDAPREPVSLLVLAAMDYLVTGPVRFLAALRLARRDAESAFGDRLSRIGAPTLVVRGSHDPIASAQWAERAASLLPRGRSAVVDGAAHAAHYSEPDVMAALIEDFLREDSLREGSLGESSLGEDSLGGGAAP